MHGAGWIALRHQFADCRKIRIRLSERAASTAAASNSQVPHICPQSYLLVFWVMVARSALTSNVTLAPALVPTTLWADQRSPSGPQGTTQHR